MIDVIGTFEIKHEFETVNRTERMGAFAVEEVWFGEVSLHVANLRVIKLAGWTDSEIQYGVFWKPLNSC